MTIDPDPDPSDQRTDIRPSPIAGLWYSSSPKQLSQEIDSYLEASLPHLNGELVGLIAPHAGYRYSGRTAGYAFSAVKDAAYDLVVILSPLHAYHPAAVLTCAHSAYVTPLGPVALDQSTLDALETELAGHGISLARVANDSEHSLEIELPFLQRALRDEFRLLPLMVRSLDAALLETLADTLAKVVQPKVGQSRSVLLVGSTDLSHFYPQNTARRFDEEMLRRIEAFSPEGVLAAEHSGKGFACGAGAVATVLWAAKRLGAESVKILHHSTSADETGDRSSVVGYGAAAILKNK